MPSCGKIEKLNLRRKWWWRNMSSKLLRGTFVLTLGTYISRILGMVYLIPSALWSGRQAVHYFNTDTTNTLYFWILLRWAFRPLFLNLFPNIIPKGLWNKQKNAKGGHVSYARHWNDCLFHSVFIRSDFCGNIAWGKDNNGLTIDHVVYVIRMVSLALLVVPIMSLVRGFFQGHQMMGPTAVSRSLNRLSASSFYWVRHSWFWKFSTAALWSLSVMQPSQRWSAPSEDWSCCIFIGTNGRAACWRWCRIRDRQQT